MKNNNINRKNIYNLIFKFKSLLSKYYLDSSKFISSLFLCFSIIILLYVVYRAEFYHSGAKFDFYIKYYLLSGLLIILSIASYYLKKKN